MRLLSLSFLSFQLVFLAISAGQPQRGTEEEDNVILHYETDTHSRYEAGQPGKAVKGFYSWTDKDGRKFRVTYVADDKGYRATVEEDPHPVIINPSPDGSSKTDRSGEPAEESPAAPDDEQLHHVIDVPSIKVINMKTSSSSSSRILKKSSKDNKKKSSSSKIIRYNVAFQPSF